MWAHLGQIQLGLQNDLKHSLSKLNTLRAQSYLGHTLGKYSWGKLGAKRVLNCKLNTLGAKLLGAHLGQKMTKVKQSSGVITSDKKCIRNL